VVAASDTQVFSINPGRMTEVMYCDARFGLNLMQFLAQQIDCLQELFVGTALHDVEWRLMRILVRFAQDESNISGKDPERGIIVRNIPSQTELAGLVGCSRESLSRTSTILQQRGLVVLRGSRRVIQLTPLFLNALNLTVQDFPTPAARSF
jgi:CRP-like cAMP-binding protein